MQQLLAAVAATGVSSVYNVQPNYRKRPRAVKVDINGTPTACSVTLKGKMSPNDTQWATLATFTQATPSQVQFVQLTPLIEFSVDTLTGGTAPTVDAYVDAQGV